ncbi:MAG: 3-deoxy-manno-octulosonate cytidylyltransferase [Flavobacteriales bacterium]
MVKTAIIIPARFASSRFPGKPLADIQGKTMIQRVIEQCLKVKNTPSVLVATDDQRILDHVVSLGYRAVLTHSNHPSGTDRCYEAANLACPDADIIINVQGDEPFIQPQQIEQIIEAIRDGGASIATLALAMKNGHDPHDPNKVKVVFNRHGDALLFSRSPIPHVRNTKTEDWHKQAPFFKHIGLYGFRKDVLAQLIQLPTSPLERAESLEQLRWLEAGFPIRVLITEHESIGIDTPEDLAEVNRI